MAVAKPNLRYDYMTPVCSEFTSLALVVTSSIQFPCMQVHTCTHTHTHACTCTHMHAHAWLQVRTHASGGRTIQQHHCIHNNRGYCMMQDCYTRHNLSNGGYGASIVVQTQSESFEVCPKVSVHGWCYPWECDASHHSV